MTGFLSRIQGMFAAKYSGRYFSTLLCELAYQDAQSFAQVFGLDRAQRASLKSAELQIEPEWCFKGASGKPRRADLAILAGGDPILLVEVKEADFNSPANPAQLGDYLAFVRNAENATRFVHVSRYSPTAADRKALVAATSDGLPIASVRYRDFVSPLATSKNEFSRMFHDYLKDTGVASYQTIDIEEDVKEISFFLTQALGFPHQQGLGKLHSRQAVSQLPMIFGKMFDNLEVLGEWVQNANQSLFRHRFIRRYRPQPRFDVVNLKKALSNVTDDRSVLPGRFGQYVNGGYVTFSTRGALGPGATDDGEGTGNQWLAFELGIGLWIEKSPEDKSRPISMMLYAGFEGSAFKWVEEYKENLMKFPSESQAMKRFSKLIDAALVKAVAADKESRHKALAEFVCPA